MKSLSRNISKIFFLSFLFLLPVQGAKVVNGFAAKVNGKLITKHDVDMAMRMSPEMKELRIRGHHHDYIAKNEVVEIKKKTLDRLIDNKLVLSELETMQANIPDHVVDEQIREIVRNNFKGNEQKFRNELKKQNTTWRNFREIQRERMLVNAFVLQRFGDVSPATEKEIRAQYAKYSTIYRNREKDKIDVQKICIYQHDLDDITVTPESAKKLADSLMSQLKKGANFSALAKKYSDGAYAEQGGSEGLLPRSDLNSDFALLVFSVPPRKAIGPLPEPRGYLIVKVNKVVFGPPSESLEKVRKHMERRVLSEKRQKKFRAWAAEKRQTAMIEIEPSALSLR